MWLCVVDVWWLCVAECGGCVVDMEAVCGGCVVAVCGCAGWLCVVAVGWPSKAPSSVLRVLIIKT